MEEAFANWEGERRTLMARKISDFGLSISGSRVEKMVEQLYAELAAKKLAFRPPVYLSDQWGCPDGTPLIGVPFYLADPRLAQIEDDLATVRVYEFRSGLPGGRLGSGSEKIFQISVENPLVANWNGVFTVAIVLFNCVLHGGHR